MTIDCLFCERENALKYIIEESQHFYVRAPSKGAIAPGHVMIVSKSHVRCLGEISKSLGEEYLELEGRIKNKITQRFSYPLAIEQGIHGQSVFHAHKHLFPDRSEWYDFTGENRRFLSFLPEEILYTEGHSLDDVRKVFEEDEQYVTIEEGGKLYVCRTKILLPNTLRPMREFTAKATGITTYLYWQTMSADELVKNDMWIRETMWELRC